jgi:hypothetical protein
VLVNPIPHQIAVGCLAYEFGEQFAASASAYGTSGGDIVESGLLIIMPLDVPQHVPHGNRGIKIGKVP